MTRTNPRRILREPSLGLTFPCCHMERRAPRLIAFIRLPPATLRKTTPRGAQAQQRNLRTMLHQQLHHRHIVALGGLMERRLREGSRRRRKQCPPDEDKGGRTTEDEWGTGRGGGGGLAVRLGVNRGAFHFGKGRAMSLRQRGRKAIKVGSGAACSGDRTRLPPRIVLVGFRTAGEQQLGDLRWRPSVFCPRLCTQKRGQRCHLKMRLLLFGPILLLPLRIHDRQNQRRTACRVPSLRVRALRSWSTLRCSPRPANRPGS